MFSFAPAGLPFSYDLVTHGLRRGLHSFAASRLCPPVPVRETPAARPFPVRKRMPA